MKTTLLDMATRFNWTLDNLVIMLLGLLIVEGFRIYGRQADPKVPREKFDFGHYIGQFANWFGLVLSLACSLTLLAVRDGFVSSVGLNIADLTVFGPFYALGVGAFGQAMMKIALKGFMGMFGAFGRAGDQVDQGQA